MQTTLVPSSGATIVEFTIDVPGDYFLIDDRTFRTVIRDICRIEKYGEVWSEETGNVESTIDDILVIIGWTSPFRFEWFKDGEYYQSRLWKKDDIWKFHEGRIDYRFSDEISQIRHDAVKIGGRITTTESEIKQHEHEILNIDVKIKQHYDNACKLNFDTPEQEGFNTIHKPYFFSGI